MAYEGDVVYFVSLLELEYFTGFCLDGCCDLGVGGWRFVRWVRCAGFGRVSKARDAFDLSCLRIVGGGGIV